MDSRKLTQSLFNVPRALIGMLHLGALPGSPGWRGGTDGGLDGVIAARLKRQRFTAMPAFMD